MSHSPHGPHPCHGLGLLLVPGPLPAGHPVRWPQLRPPFPCPRCPPPSRCPRCSRWPCAHLINCIGDGPCPAVHCLSPHHQSHVPWRRLPSRSELLQKSSCRLLGIMMASYMGPPPPSRLQSGQAKPRQVAAHRRRQAPAALSAACHASNAAPATRAGGMPLRNLHAAAPAAQL